MAVAILPGFSVMIKWLEAPRYQSLLIDVFVTAAMQMSQMRHLPEFLLKENRDE